MIRLSLQIFVTRLRGSHVLIRMDNVTAKAFINCQGGTRSQILSRETTLLFAWAEKHLLSIAAEHLADLNNTQADWLSRRRLQETERQLNPQVFLEIQQCFRVPVVDLFASASNTQVPRFFARRQQEGMEAVDALQSPWPPGLLYAFPPVLLLQRVLVRIRELRGQVILMAPRWLCRPWFPEMVHLASGPPWILPLR